MGIRQIGRECDPFLNGFAFRTTNNEVSLMRR
jgi:hypothetical protein